MKTEEEIFNLIKKSINLRGEFNDYHIRLSNGRFDRENMIGVYSIREGIAINQKNYKLAEQMHQLLIGLKNDSGILLKGVTIDGKNYSGMYYLSENYDKIIGYLDNELDEK
ncbi:enoyl-CoA hydratase [Chryseobacterium sp. MEBOG06]|uniref:enoyl-CoA hydratase n=1 Tax=Chryseobacterium sp. MEBOG06 TaxID=2879938 RepID=UPI001F2E54E7|nr:enoyl-CoA hydratase [Chryseobacterium sp. MEBOG06]UKB84855.1 enoyl-CoA hydratase [Chryseobacterium sp. MEBOG06]UKB85390.1 enoyl-CoA hydratase [Chryseobacterium sp. MEBOG06]